MMEVSKCVYIYFDMVVLYTFLFSLFISDQFTSFLSGTSFDMPVLCCCFLRTSSIYVSSWHFC